ncbi:MULTISPECIES: spore coat protein YlbD [Bacillaceae]|uniref:YlbD family protein n=1 Tax=Evansella alkalicola TaxID=745819 RepID=A0ABS6JQC8_9BACI|nr:spore coat protein YlbD [Litchfieldia alkalitelluris]MBU9720472.1 YlbD family protein [Bacillus alkalicola]
MSASHPDVRKFKNFVKNNPHVLKDVKSGDKTLQDLFEEYVLFGEDDDIWDTYRDKSNKKKSNETEADVEGSDTEDREDEEEKEEESTTTQDLLALLKKVNFNDLQNSLSQFSGVLASVQELLGQFRSTPNQGQQQNNNQQNSPFSYHDD